MGIKDIFHASKIKNENNDLKYLLTPEMQDAAKLQELIRDLEKKNSELESAIEKNEKKLSKLQEQINSKKQLLLTMDEDILVQDFGLYQPTYDFQRAELYKAKLDSIRAAQKTAIKDNSAVTGNMGWTVNGSKQQGNKMVKDMQKLLLRAFNSECDELVNKVKYNNFEASLKRLTASSDSISKLGTIMGITITRKYYQLKVEELRLALEYQIKKQEEKEAQKEARAEMREAAKLQKEIEEQRKKAEKEQAHYQKALITVLKQLDNASEETKSELLKKKNDLENELGKIETSLKDIDYREANQRAGYVYVISNIGAFGENIYKIGMTRRLDPQDRVDELGDASVPFKFDVHAMIFSDNAPKLENTLHKAFEDKKINMVNPRREFFQVTLDEIKEVVCNNFDKTVEFIDIPEADQFRESQAMRRQAHKPPIIHVKPAILNPTLTIKEIVSTANENPKQEDSNKEYIYTKWGKYIKPNPYKVNFTRNFPNK